MSRRDATRAAVVGAGLGGLAAAIRLAAAGFEVDVFEAGSDPGGKAAERRLGPYRFDTGPSLLTLAPVFDQLFEAAGRRRSDFLTFTPLDPVAEYFWPGERLSAPGSPEGLARAFATRGWAAEADTLRWFEQTRRLWELAGPLFLSRSLHDGATWRSPETWAILFRAGSLDAGRSLRQALEAQFSEPKVRQFFGRYATYNGSDPRRMPATFAMIPWVEFGLGAWSVGEGIHAIPRALHRVAADLGVSFHFSTPVRTLVHERGRVTGLRVRRETQDFDLVVSNADVARTYQLLEAEAPLKRAPLRWRNRYRRGEPSSSGVVFLWGMDREAPELGLHNVFFSPDLDAEFRSNFELKTLPDDPTVYVNISSKVTAGDAPPGHENWFVLVNAPHDPSPDPQRQAAALKALREAVLRRIETNLGRPIRGHIVQEEVLHLGESLYGLASHRALAAFDRHPNRAPGLKGLYLCGGSVHPGGGMPLALLSGKIAADLATKDWRPVQTNDGTS